jgi:lipid A 3-O-deacylase
VRHGSLGRIVIPTALLFLPGRVSGEEISQLRLAAGVFEVNPASARAGELSLQYRGGLNTGPLHPLAGVMVTTDAAAHVFAGFGIDVPLTGRWVLRPSFAPGFYHRGHGKDLGAVFEYRSGVELAVRLAGGRRLGFELDHVSNAGYGRSNRGEESVTVTFAIPLGKLGKR